MEQRWYLWNGIQLGFDWLDLVGQLLVELSSWIMDNEVKTWIPPWQHVVDSAVVPECRVVNCCHLTPCLARLLFLKKREYNNSFTPQRRIWVLYTRNKKEESYFWSQRKVWRGAEMGTILPFKGHSGSGWFNKHLLGEDFHKKELSQSQDVSLFSNWRNYSAVVRHKCFEQSAKITWCTNGTHDWQEK